ncbi:MAG: FkbM family methyltransferase [Flavobacteriales bacterium]|nr:FkbM family methyltransferase [Flavobacteriales bacterium]
MKKLFKRVYSAVPFKHFVFKQLRKLRLSEKVYKHLHFTAPIRIKYKKADFVMFHYGYRVENDLFWAGYGNSWEGNSLKIWYKLVNMHHKVADIGANTGVYALTAASSNSAAQVAAFEPVDRVCGRLESNVKLNNYQIKTHNLALSNYKGTAEIFTEGQDHVYSVTVNKDISNTSSPKTREEIRVDRLDNVFDAESFPDLIKIDVETHEAEVIEGMGSLLDTMPTMLVEVLNDQVAESIEGLLSHLDYQVYDVPDKSEIRKLSRVQKAKDFNLLFCTEEVAKQLGIND